ncbi:methyl-accepting chemotaxis protein [Clostridium sp.]|uniref:methyl-accepting chemotaxis protein n=1 Tax=Clostridium sp. TaxID=1506 RepID=UPI002FC69B87
MFRKIRNMKLSNLVSFLSMLSIIVVLIIGLIGYTDIKIINSNMTTMYKDRLIPITNLAKIRASYLSIRVQVNQSYLSYSTDYGKKIEEYDLIIQENIRKYETSKVDDKEVQLLTEFKEYYAEYQKIWDKVNNYTSKGEKIKEEDVSSFNEVGNKIVVTLQSLFDYNETVADKVNSDSDKIYNSTIISFMMILAISLVIFAIVAAIIVRNIKADSKDIINKLEAIAKGDFTIYIETDGTNEFGIMKKSLAETINKISGLLENIKEKALVIEGSSQDLSAVSEEMSSSSENISAAIQDVAKGAGEQTEDIVNVTNVLNQFGDQLENIIEAIRHVDNNSKLVDAMAGENGSSMKEIVESLGGLRSDFSEFVNLIIGLGKNISQINEITNLINNISEQTNLLALNAAIESARAGEAGRGFAVVAEEIRKLAEQSKISSENINRLISSISTDTESIIKNTNGMEVELESQINKVNNSIQSFGKMINAIEKIIPQIESINNSSTNIEKDQNIILEKIEATASVAEEVSTSTEEVAASSQEMNASSEEVAATAQNLNYMAKEMTEQINVFKLK